MKNRYLLIGTFASAILASVAIINPFTTDVEGTYKSRVKKSSDVANRTANHYFEYMHSLKMDPATGEVDEELVRRTREEAKTLFSRVDVIEWSDEGPSNIGGRTRAILVDNQNQWHVLAGSVSGGLWESGSRGDYWAKVATFEENLAVSSIAQTANGTIVVGTGHYSEGHFGTGGSGAYGNGVYVYANGDLTQTPVRVAGSEDWLFVNEVFADTVNNKVWIASTGGSGFGFHELDVTTMTLTDRSGDAQVPQGAIAGCISPDGRVVLVSGSGRTMVSTDYGVTFAIESGNNPGDIPQANGRAEYAISHETVNGEYFIYASFAAGTTGAFGGAHVSSNSGQDWSEIAPASGSTGQFNPFNSQGNYNNIISVQKGNPARAFLGGIDIYSWTASTANPTFGSWNQVSNWALSPTSPIYAHADQHEMKWDNLGRFYIGNDGGVGYSDDNGQTYVPANRGYNVTQFYSVGYSAHGDVMGGTQDNGTLFNDHTNFAWQDHTEIFGGDGFDCDISHTNRNMVFSTIYFSGVYRSSDRGVTQYPFFPNQLNNGAQPGSSSNGVGSFHTVIRFHEVFDLNTTDSVIYLPSMSYSAGTDLVIPSNSTGDSIFYTTVDTIRHQDTVNYDPNIFHYEYVVSDCISGANRDMGIEHPWVNLNSGQYPPLIGDSIIFQNDIADLGDDDTVIVCDTIKYRFYFATDPNNLDTLAMHMDSVLYNVPWDTITVQDPYISWLALGIGEGRWVNGSTRDLGIWMTRYAKRFSDNVGDNRIWLNVLPVLGGRVSCMEFSRNADFLYVGTYEGRLYRLTGFNEYYASTPGIVDSLQGWSITPPGNPTVVQSDRIWSSSRVVTGIGIDYSSSNPNGDHMIVTTGGFVTNGIHAYEITNASTCGVGGANASAIHAAGEFDFPIYDAIIDRNDPNFVALATEYGVYVSENISAGTITWESCSGDFGFTPVHSIRQDWRTWNEGSYKPGAIYVGTHGRGIWSSTSLLSMPDDMNVGIDKEEFNTNLTLFPNPMVSNGFLKFELENNSDVYVNIYSLSGKLVQNVSRANMPKGENTMDFNVSNLPIGTYIVEFKAGNQVETSKFVKTR